MSSGFAPSHPGGICTFGNLSSAAVVLVRSTLEPPSLAAFSGADKPWFPTETGTSDESRGTFCVDMPIWRAYIADEASMTIWVVATACAAEILAAIALCWRLWRKHKVKLCEADRKWREAQLAQLECVKERLKLVIDVTPAEPLDLPSVPLAGLLAPPGEGQLHPQ